MRRGPFLILKVGITFLAYECHSLSTTHGGIPSCSTTIADSTRHHHDANTMTPPATRKPLPVDRRSILQGILPTLAWLVATPPSAQALQARNEILCGTGFFTNIAQYKCTEIGDISQDGKVKSLTSTEEGSIQSLLDKLGVDTTTTVITEDGKETEGNENGELSKLNKSQLIP